jgi:hypothetical protein
LIVNCVVDPHLGIVNAGDHQLDFAENIVDSRPPTDAVDSVDILEDVVLREKKKKSNKRKNRGLKKKIKRQSSRASLLLEESN